MELNNKVDIHSEDYIFNINDFDYEDEELDYDLGGVNETERRMKEELGFDEEGRIFNLYYEYKQQLEMEENRKKERNRLYKTDKKCYNIIKDDKNCQNGEGITSKKDKTEDRIYTRVNIRKIKKLLTYNDITYSMLAEKLGVSKRTIIRKMNVYIDLTANELIEIAELLDTDITELIYKNKH